MQIQLLPQPRELTTEDGSVTLSNDQTIAAGPATAQTLARLQTALGSVGMSIQTGDADPFITLQVTPNAGHAQGYELQISADGVTVTGDDEAGLWYGCCTLAQLIEGGNGTLPLLHIRDWPDFPNRGVMLDISRDKVPSMDTLRTLIDTLAGWKINQIQLYTEHTFAYRNHQDVWKNASPMTGDEIRELDQFCTDRFVELLPNQSTFGHMERWLIHPAYAHMAETMDEFDTPWGTRMKGPFSLNPAEPDSLVLIRELLDELLPFFSSQTVNVNCDETVDLGQGRSKALVEERGAGRVYLDFLKQIAAEVKARNHIMQFWGDIIIQHPDLVPELPDGLIALEWGYEANHPFAEHGATFAKSGIPFYVCPGTSAWCSLGGRTDNSLGNLRNAAENGLSHGASGYLITDWGDRGHWQHLPISYIGLLAGAAYSWAWEANRDLDVAAAASEFAFHDRTGAMGQAAYDLGNVYRMLGREPGNSSVLFWILQPFEIRTGELPDPQHLLGAKAAIEQAMDQIDESQPNRPDADLLRREWHQTGRLLSHACNRALMLQESDQAAAAQQRAALHQDLADIIDEQRSLWLARNRPGGLSDSVARFEQLLHSYEDAQ